MSLSVGLFGLFGALVSMPLLRWGRRFNDKTLVAIERWCAWQFPLVFILSLTLLYPWHFVIVLIGTVASVAIWVFIAYRYAKKDWHEGFHRVAAFGIALILICELWLFAVWGLFLTGGVAIFALSVFIVRRYPELVIHIETSKDYRVSVCVIFFMLLIVYLFACPYIYTSLWNPHTIEWVGGSRASPALIGVLTDSDLSVRQEAVGILVQTGKPAVPALEAALKDGHSYAAAGILVQIGKPAVPALIAALKDQDADVRLKVVIALCEIGDKFAVPALEAALKDQNTDVRDAAMEALKKIR